MSENTGGTSSSINNEQIIDEICNLVLVYEDHLDIEKGKKYIEKHISTDIQLNVDRYSIRSVVQRKIAFYIEQCPSTIQLFVFASNNNYHIYRKQFNDYYHEYYYSTGRQHSSLVYPPEIDVIFDCIQEAIDFHTLYEKFSIKMSDEAVQRAIEEASAASREAADAASDAQKAALVAARIAQKAAGAAADKAVKSAIKQVIDEEKVEKRINDSVDKQMGRVTTRISETSVTILGIFSGIVLTVVAGLFYSSSVLDNINAANFFRLLGAASLVGLVCYHLLVVMFRFIEKFKTVQPENGEESKKTEKKDCTNFISIVLVVILVISCVLQFVFPTDSNDFPTVPDEPTTNTNVVVDSNKADTQEETSSETTADETESQAASDVSEQN